MSEPAGIVFGPVPSRRLGSSLGINHVPSKTCTYACVYCQVGRTNSLLDSRRTFHAPQLIERGVAQRLERAARDGQRIDYLTFVPNGEPTLDANLGQAIRCLKRLGPRVAVVTNASLLWQAEVRDDLAEADWVSVKVDTVRATAWRRLNRPHARLTCERVLAGMRAFASTYRGTLTTETMLMAGLNDSEEEVAEVACHVAELGPTTAYIAVPLRPPAEPWVRMPNDHVLVRAYEIIRGHVPAVRFLTRDEDNTWQGEPDVEDALLAIAAIHPMRAESVARLLESAHADWTIVERLVREKRLECVHHRDHDFYRAHRA